MSGKNAPTTTPFQLEVSFVCPIAELVFRFPKGLIRTEGDPLNDRYH